MQIVFWLVDNVIPLLNMKTLALLTPLRTDRTWLELALSSLASTQSEPKCDCLTMWMLDIVNGKGRAITYVANSMLGRLNW